MSTNSNDTLFGGRAATVFLVDGTSQAIKVRQLWMSDYERALPLLSDEIALTAFFCVPAEAAENPKPFDKAWALKLQPKSYEQLYAIAKEVNAEGFFSYAARHQEKERAHNAQWIQAAADLPPEVLKTAMEIGKSRSPSSLPKPR